jgi:hypothetical protein
MTKYRVTWSENGIEYVTNFVSETAFVIQQVPEQFRKQSGASAKVKILRVEEVD